MVRDCDDKIPPCGGMTVVFIIALTSLRDSPEDGPPEVGVELHAGRAAGRTSRRIVERVAEHPRRSRWIC